MDARRIKSTISAYQRNNVSSAIFTYIYGTIINYFSPLITELESFIAPLDDETILTPEQQCTLLYILADNGGFHHDWTYKPFSALICYLWFYKEFRSPFSDYENSTIEAIIILLCRVSLLTPENIGLCVQQSQHNRNPSSALKILLDANLLNQENIELVMVLRNAAEVAEICVLLNDHDLLDPFRETLRNGIYYTERLLPLIKSLVYYRLLTFDNVSSAFKYDHFFTYQVREILDSMHRELANQTILDNIFAACGRHHQPGARKELVQAEIYEICKPYQRVIYGFNRVGAITLPLLFNPEQSTHTASVHRTVSSSAARLMQRYQEHIKEPRQQLYQMQKWLAQYAGPSLIHDIYDQYIYLAMCMREANTYSEKLSQIKNIMLLIGRWPFIPIEYPFIHQARSGLQHIQEVQCRHFDFASQITTLQLVALVWTAIHDDDLMNGKRAAVLDRLAQCLSEIPKDASCQSFICPPGIFNKLMESLDKQHPDVEIIYINHDSIVLKFEIIVNEELCLYYLDELEHSPTPETASEILKKLKDLDSLLSCDVIDNIQKQVDTRMWDEFSSYYITRNDARYTGLLSSIKYMPFKDRLGTSVYAPKH